jgi:hypothetical protein
MSAAATEIVVRLGLATTRGQIGLAALVLSIATMTIAYVVIGKHRPPAEAPPSSAGLVGQSGAPS